MKMLLVGGLPSSGSTHLIEVLSCLNDVFCLAETGLFVNGEIFGDTDSDGTNFRLHVPWIDLEAKIVGALGQHLSTVSNLHYEKIVHELSHSLGIRDKIIVEKTPENVFGFFHYVNEWRNPVICTIRDLRECIDSLLRRGLPFWDSLALLVSSTWEILRLKNSFQDLCHIVDYRDLVHSEKKLLHDVLHKIIPELKPVATNSKEDKESIFRRKNHQFFDPTEVAEYLRSSASEVLTKNSWRLSPKKIQADTMILKKNRVSIYQESVMDSVFWQLPGRGPTTASELWNIAESKNFQNIYESAHDVLDLVGFEPEYLTQIGVNIGREIGVFVRK